MNKSFIILRLETMKAEIELLLEHLNHPDEPVEEPKKKRKPQSRTPLSSWKPWTEEDDELIHSAVNDKKIEVTDILPKLQDRTIYALRTRIHVLGYKVAFNRIVDKKEKK